MANHDNQRILFEAPKPECPYIGLIEHDNTHCDVHILEPDGYETVGENSFNRDDWEMDVRGFQLDDVIARDIIVPPLPLFIPNVTRAQHHLYRDYVPEFVTVNLGKLVSPVKLNVAASLNELLGLPPTTKIIVQCYGKDRLIENIWPNMYELLQKIARLHPYAITSINYSIWGTQNHFEQLMNIKRNYLSFEMMQELGMAAIPHIYWTGQRTLQTAAKWLSDNPSIEVVAMNLQTMRKESDWQQTMVELEYFMTIIPRQLHFLVTGPITVARIQQVKSILGSVTLSNGYVSYKARAHYQLGITGDKIHDFYSPDSYSQILESGVELYDNLMAISV